jgi:hypothetical protein
MADGGLFFWHLLSLRRDDPRAAIRMRAIGQTSEICCVLVYRTLMSWGRLNCGRVKFLNFYLAARSQDLKDSRSFFLRRPVVDTCSWRIWETSVSVLPSHK